ncbi:hypothetical protein BCR33DRAFT_697593 [Rhizoclosmatium globosum]|uniref:Solute carrier family 40 member n=1 Tax=Rhizoclosmatium globosum TaxID=329046 RepID=A0A1Y2CD12_9FUNG|nr:hypothetical protein BCR33DRAFT_697593 [Rhizoclosmatium globosum]|eukprot:ORY44922.1 hypothetical protein BCR33DRAFT_697593 [Rhizoclosmatium globosum]
MPGLATSYFFTTWATRMDEWVAAIMIATIYPQSLLQISIYSFFLTITSIVCGAYVGEWAASSSRSRLATLRSSVIVQKLAIATSAVLLWLSYYYFPDVNSFAKTALFCAVIVSGSMLRLANRASTIAVEKDWAVVICMATQEPQSIMNAKLRRIDLICKLAAPLAVSLVAIPLTVPETMLIVSGFALLSIPIELSLLTKVYNALPELQTRIRTFPTPTTIPNTSSPASAVSITPPILIEELAPPPLTLYQAWKKYLNHQTFLASLSLSLLYLTTLSFGPTMITYLLTLSYTPTFLAVMRSLSVIAGLVATYTTPVLLRNLGLIRTGVISLWSQVASLLPVLLSFYVPGNPGLQAFLFFTGVTFSRLGLWSFDMVQMQIVQETVVGEEDVGVFNGCEFALQNGFELASYIITMIFSKPEEFVVGVWLSVGAVGCGAFVFTVFAARRRARIIRLTENSPLRQ